MYKLQNRRSYQPNQQYPSQGNDKKIVRKVSKEKTQTQAGFRPNRSYGDQIFNLRTLMEKRRESRINLIMVLLTTQRHLLRAINIESLNKMNCDYKLR